MIKIKNTPEIRFNGFTDDWEQCKLVGLATELVAGGDIDKGLIKENGKYPVIANALTNEGIVGFYDKEYRIKAPAVTITGRGDVGHAKARKDDFTPVVRLVTLKSKHDVDFIENAINRLNIIVESTGVPQLTVPQLGKYELYFPKSAKEEKTIGKLFVKIDNLITLHQNKYHKLVMLKKSMLEKMFPREGRKVPEVRFTGYTDDWEQCRVGDYYFFKNGLNKGKEFFGHGVPIVNFTDVFHNRGINPSNLKGKVDLTPSEISNYSVQKGDLFFTRTSETIDDIGRPSVMLDKPVDTVFSGFILRARALKKDPLELNFKSYVFFTNVFRNEMIMKSSMTTRALTSGTAIKKMEFLFPQNKNEQNKIGSYFKELDNLITLQQQKLEKLKNIKKSCLEKMFI